MGATCKIANLCPQSSCFDNNMVTPYMRYFSFSLLSSQGTLLAAITCTTTLPQLPPDYPIKARTITSGPREEKRNNSFLFRSFVTKIRFRNAIFGKIELRSINTLLNYKLPFKKLNNSYILFFKGFKATLRLLIPYIM